jgi:hypothetical protein
MFSWRGFEMQEQRFYRNNTISNHMLTLSNGNIVKSAHRKIADALVKGKAIKIKGVVYDMAGMRKFKCYEYSHIWERAYDSGRPGECPRCKNRNIHRVEE